MNWTTGGLADTTTWGLIVGVVLPWLTALVQQPTWSTGTRRAVAVAAAVVGGVLTALANGTIGEGKTVLATVAAVLVAAQATYESLWRGGVATSIEYATSRSARSSHTGGDVVTADTDTMGREH